MPPHATFEYTFSIAASFLVLDHIRELDSGQPFRGLQLVVGLMIGGSPAMLIQGRPDAADTPYPNLPWKLGLVKRQK